MGCCFTRNEASQKLQEQSGPEAQECHTDMPPIQDSARWKKHHTSDEQATNYVLRSSPINCASKRPRSGAVTLEDSDTEVGTSICSM